MPGVYYVTVLPETSKLEEGIRQAGARAERGMKVRPEFDTSRAQPAGQQAGREVQAGLDSQARSGGGLRGFFRTDGARSAGQQAGNEINTGLQSANIGTGLHTQLRTNLGDGESVGRSLGTRIVSGLRSATTIGAAAAVGGIGYALTKGFGRLTEIDTAQFKLKALGHDAASVQGIMDNATTAVKGTAFALNEAATTSAAAVAAGIKPGQDLTKYLGTTADAAAVAGTSLAEMGSIFNKVQTSNKAYTGDLQMLSDRGVPIFQWIAKEAGVSADEVAKMASKGRVSSEMFRTAIEKNIGGAAKGMGGSFRGALANLNASISRFGAGLAAPLVEGLRPLLSAGTNVFDGITKAMGPGMKSMTANVKGWSEDLSNKINAWATNGGVERAAARIGQVWNTTVSGLRTAATWVKQLWDDMRGNGGGEQAGTALKSVGDAAKNLGGAARDAGPAIQTIGSALVSIGPETLSGVLVPALKMFGVALKFASDNASWVLPLAGGFFLLRSAVQTAVPFMQAYAATANIIRTPVIMAQAAAQWALTRAMREHTAALAANTGAQIRNDTATNAGVIAKTRAAASAMASMIAEKARSAATKIGTGIQLAFNAVMAMNPMVLLVAAVVAAGVAIWAFFTKTETGRKLWDKIWNGIKSVTSAVVGWFRNTALPWLQGFFTKVGEVAMWLWHNIITPAWEGIKLAIRIAIEVIKGYIEGWMAAFRVIETVLTWVWKTIVVPIFEGIKAFIKAAVDRVKEDWNTLVSTAEAVWTGVRDKFTSLVNFVKELPGKIATAAKGMWDGISGAFKSMVNGLIDMWNGLANKLSFTVPDIVGMPSRGEKVSPIPTIAKLATGGIIRGPGNGTSDDILAQVRGGGHVAVSNGESINTELSTRENWWLFSQLNAGKTLGEALQGFIPAFAGGGVVTDSEVARMGGGTVNLSLLRAVRAQFPKVGLNSAKTDHDVDGGYHPKGKAIDLAPDDQVAGWLFSNRKALGLGQIIYGGAGGRYTYYNINGTEAEGQKAIDIFGSSVVFGQHSDHIHVMANSEIGAAVSTNDDGSGSYDSSGTPGGSGSSTTYSNAGGASSITSAAAAKSAGIVPVWIENWPSSIGSGASTTSTTDSGTTINVTDNSTSGGTSGGGSDVGAATSTTGATTTSTTGKSLKQGATVQEMINEVVRVGKAKGMSQADIESAAATLLAESGGKNYANSKVAGSTDRPHDAVGADGKSLGVMQQQSGMGWGTDEQLMDPTYAIGKYYERLASVAGRDKMSVAQRAQAVQKSAHADGSNYAAKLAEAQKLIGAAGTTTGTSSAATTIGAATSTSTGNRRAATSKELDAAAKKTSTKSEAVTQAQQSVDDHEYRVTQAQKKLADVQAKTKQTNSKGKPLADADDVAKAERALMVANRELTDAKKRLTKATGNAEEATQAEAELKTKGVETKSKTGKSKDSSSSSNGLNGSDFGKTFVSGVLETIGLDGSVFSNPFEWPTVKSIMAGINWLGGLTSGKGKDSADGAQTQGGGFTDGVADQLGLGGFLKNVMPGSQVGAATSKTGAGQSTTTNSVNPATSTTGGGTSVADKLASTMTSVLPTAQPAQAPAPVDNRITVNAPGQSAEQIYTKLRTEQTARTRSTVVRG